MTTPSDYADWVARGRAHQAAARPFDAMFCFRRALRLDARAVEARYHLGETLWSLGLTGDALTLWEQAVQSQPAWHPPWLALAEGRLATGDDARARAAADGALALAPQDARARVIRAIARMAIEGSEDAVDEAARLLQVEPEWAEVDVLGPALARALDRAAVSGSAAGIAVALAPRTASLPSPLLARIAEHLPASESCAPLLSAMRERDFGSADDEAVRRLAFALRARDPEGSGARAQRYAVLCTGAHASALPPLWPRRAAGEMLRVAVLALSATDPHLDVIRQACAALPAGDAAVTVFVLATDAAPAGSAVAPTAECIMPLPAGNAVGMARRIAFEDPDILIDLAGLAAPIGALLAARPARAIWTLEGIAARNVSPLVDRALPMSAGALADAFRAELDRARSTPACASTSAELAGLWEKAVRAQDSHAPAEADAHCRALIGEQPGFAPALALLGTLAEAAGRKEEAAGWIAQAVAAAPDYVDARVMAARLALERSDAEGARSLAADGLARQPRNAALWRLAGHAELAQGRAQAAVDAFAQALAQEPVHAETHYNYGVAMRMAKNPKEAGRAYQRALFFAPDLVDAEYNLGVLLHELGHPDAANAALEHVLSVDPACASAYAARGEVLLAHGRTGDYLANFAAFEANCPRAPALTVHAIEACQYRGDFVSVDGYVRRLVETQFDDLRARETVDLLEIALQLLLYVDIDEQDYYRLTRAYDAAARRVYGEPLPRTASRRPGRIRVGYLSGDLRNHVMGKMMWQAISLHDRRRFEVFLYSLSNERDDWTARFESCADHYASIADLADLEAVARIAGDDLDLLVDLSTHTKGARPAILARKPARVQVTHIASAGPLGLSAVDFKLTDSLADLPESARYQIEAPLPMAGCVYPYRHIDPPATHLFSRAALGVREEAVLIGAFANPLKLSRRCLSLWRAVLERVPGARLVFSPMRDAYRAIYVRLASAAGIDPARCLFVPQGRDEAENQARYAMIDFALDPMPYGGVNATIEALDAGVPVVTLVGRRHGERSSYSILANLGVERTAANSGGDYVETAVQLATDAGFMRETREAIRRGLVSSPLTDMPGHARNLEAAYVAALELKAPGVLTAPSLRP